MNSTIMFIIILVVMYVQIHAQYQNHGGFNHSLSEVWIEYDINFYYDLFTKTITIDNSLGFTGYSGYSNYMWQDHRSVYFNSSFLNYKLSYTPDVFFDTCRISSINFADFKENDKSAITEYLYTSNTYLNKDYQSVNISNIVRIVEMIRENVFLKSLRNDSHNINIAGLNAGRYFVKIKVNLSNR